MKTSEQIRKEIEKTTKMIEALTNKVVDLDNIDARRAAAEAKDFETLKALRAEADSNQEAIKIISDEIYLLKIVRKILQENERAAFAEESIPIIKEIYKPFDGKKLGDKTREKIRESARAHEIGVYIDTHSYSVESSIIKAYRLSKDGYSVYGSDIELFTSYETPFLTKDNTIAIENQDIKNPYTYIENPKKHAKAIIKAYEAHKKATEKALQTQSALNALLPRGINSIRNIETVYATLNI